MVTVVGEVFEFVGQFAREVRAERLWPPASQPFGQVAAAECDDRALTLAGASGAGVAPSPSGMTPEALGQLSPAAQELSVRRWSTELGRSPCGPR